MYIFYTVPIKMATKTAPVRVQTRISAKTAIEQASAARTVKKQPVVDNRRYITPDELNTNPRLGYQRVKQGVYRMTINSNKTPAQIAHNDFEDIVNGLMGAIPSMWEWDDKACAWFGVKPELVDVDVKLAFEESKTNHLLHCHADIAISFYGYGRLSFRGPQAWLHGQADRGQADGSLSEYDCKILRGMNVDTRGRQGDIEVMKSLWYQTKNQTTERVNRQIKDGTLPTPLNPKLANL
jgi:hypothetical protein